MSSEEIFILSDYRPKINKTNNYGYDPEEQRTKTYTGMGMDINVHDQWAVESPGAIFNRENEHLGAADKGIIRFRKVLIKSIAEVMEGNPLHLCLTQITKISKVSDQWRLTQLHRETVGRGLAIL